MVLFNILPKILYKPREAYEELQGNVTSKEGIFVFVFTAILSLIIYGGFSKLLGIKVMPIAFGFGTKMALLSISMEFLQTAVSLILLAWLVNKLALKFGGIGNFDETLGMLGYSKFLGIVQATFGIFVLMGIYARNMQIVAAIESGVATKPAFSFILALIVIGTTIPFIWELWIQGTAISVEHVIRFPKSVGILALSIAIVSAILFLVDKLFLLLLT